MPPRPAQSTLTVLPLVPVVAVMLTAVGMAGRMTLGRLRRVSLRPSRWKHDPRATTARSAKPNPSPLMENPRVAGVFRSRPVSRILSRVTIHLGHRFPGDSSGYPAPRRATCERSLFALHQTGFGKPPCRHDAGGLLPHLFTLTGRHLRRCAARRCPLCATFRRLSPPGISPAPCPSVSGLSSDRCAARGHPACLCSVALRPRNLSCGARVGGSHAPVAGHPRNARRGRCGRRLRWHLSGRRSRGRAAGRRGTCGRNGLRHRDERILRDQQHRGGHDVEHPSRRLPRAEAAADRAEKRGRSAGGCLRQLLHHERERQRRRRGGYLQDSAFPHPKELTVVRPGEAIRITIVGTHLVVPAGCAPASGCASAVTIYPLGCGPERAVADFELSKATTRWTSTSSPARTSSRCSRTSTTAPEPPGILRRAGPARRSPPRARDRPRGRRPRRLPVSRAALTDGATRVRSPQGGRG